MTVDVQDLGCDFYAFSGHKLFGPTGIGILYGRESLLERMPPWQGGGDMILTVTFRKTTYNGLPYKFEAGTPNISGAIGLGAAIDYVSAMDRDGAHAHEHALLAYASERLSKIEGLRIVGTARDKASLVSFVVAGVHPHDLGTILDEDGIAIRTGHHCAMPVMEYFKLPATARASFAFYNTFEEIDRLNLGIRRARSIFA
jgi:cysteine desulfurase/selenocysteine lyase